jgi:hypothetical protein
MLMTETALLAVLRAECGRAGSQRAWAARHGLAESYIADLLKGRRSLGPKVLGVLGYERAVLYRRKGSGAPECLEKTAEAGEDDQLRVG